MHRNPPSYVVGIAASVDQLGTLGSFLDAMPVDSGMAFVIIEQSPMNAKQLTCEMLSRYTKIPIYGEVDDVVVERDAVYLIPADRKMVITGGQLIRIEGESGEESSLPVDIFFRSLAQSVGERACCVMLSGTLCDASHDVLAIGEAGGRVIALEETAKFDAMARVTSEAGFVELPASRLSDALLMYAKRRAESRWTDDPQVDLALSLRTVSDRSESKQGDRASAAADAQRVKELKDLCGVCPRERALAAANAQLAGILNAATQVSICATDTDGMITLFNSGAENMLGYKSRELVGKKTPEIFHLETEINNHGKKLSRELGRELDGFEVFVACAKEGRFERREWTYVRKDGRHLTVNLVVTAVRNTSGEITGFLGVAEDITERKQAEAALERSAAEIQRANETLRIAESEARKAVVERDQFLAMLSHELRNPLSAILNGVGVLDHTDADREAVARAQRAIQEQADHMSRLLDDLLDVARVTHGKIDFRKRVLDLNDLVHGAVQAVQPAMEARRQRLSVIPTVGPVMVEGDPTRLLQIIQNLLTNASKYTPSEGAVTLELKNEVDECALSVRDNGLGIDADMLDEVFGMFFQSNKALDRSDGGMGVGLTLVRTLVEMHGGTVTAHSDGLGHGSQFVVRLPLTSKPPGTSEQQTSVPAGFMPRILLVEDNPGSRDMLQTILTLDGFEVEVAEDGQQGLEAILTGRPDVALIDLGLPKLDGYEVARHVRRQLNRSEVYLVALTGYGQAKDREAVFQAGFDEHLVKPVNPEQLTRVLRTPRNPR